MALARAGVLRGCAVAADRHTADRMREAGLGPVLEPIYTCDRVITATEAGASALGDAIHGLRGPAAATPELPA
jgi:hypothetical protein